jgi:hypothetical protein
MGGETANKRNEPEEQGGRYQQLHRHPAMHHEHRNPACHAETQTEAA